MLFLVKMRPCDNCGNFCRPIHSERYGLCLCRSCYNKKVYNDVSLHEHCSICSKLKPVNARANGKPVCAVCQKKEKARNLRKKPQIKKIKPNPS